MAPLQNAGLFLIQVVFDFYIFIVLLRILFQKLKIDFHNPLSQWVWKMTNPLLVRFRSYLPNYAGLDTSAIILLLLVQVIKFNLIVMLQIGQVPNITGVIILAIADSAAHLINIFFYAIILSVLMSWINPMAYNPVMPVLLRLTEPLLQPVRRFIPAVGGIDLTPIPVMIGLKLIQIVFIDPLFLFGKGLL